MATDHGNSNGPHEQAGPCADCNGTGKAGDGTTCQACVGSGNGW